ncbi:MAG: thiamine pyrophosphate-binding protein [SAR324 cluster bacterium]
MQTLSGRQALLSILKDEGVDHLFGNPGTTELPLLDALVEVPDIRYVLGLQEAIAMAMADGFSRASGRLSAVSVHVAPGLGNAIGSVYNAKFFGSPVLVMAGQQEHGLSLTEPMLHDDLVKIAAPVTKWATEVARAQDLPRTIRRAAKVALTPPTGPVFVSLPRDVLMETAEMELGARTRVETAARPSDALVERLAGRLLAAQNPVIVSGHEVYTGDAFAELARVAELLGAAVYTQTVAYVALFPTEHPSFMGELGRVQTAVRALLEPHDLLFDVGSDNLRMANPSPVEPLPPGMPVVQVGSRDWELGKNYPAEIALRADVKQTLLALIPALERSRTAAQAEQARLRAQALIPRNWAAKRRQLAARAQGQAGAKPIAPEALMMALADLLPPEAVVVEEGLTSTRTLLGFLPIAHRQRFYGLASGGIGFAIAGAVGIQLALPGRPVVAVIGDGSAMYAPQALWTAAHLKLPITYVIANNFSYRILKERVFALNGPAAAQERFPGMDFRDPSIDFPALARSMGVQAFQVADPRDLVAVLRGALAADGGPRLVDVHVAGGYKG